ncbi:MAG: FHA domain-containing protein, partial [Acidobacteria bacterium]
MSFGLTYEGETIPITREIMIVGRSRSCDIPINDPSVSRRHARILISPAQMVVEDLGSSNGTLVNGKRIHDRQTLGHGDQLMLGDAVLVAQVTSAGDEPPPPPPPTAPGDATMLLQSQSVELAAQVETTADPPPAAPPPAAGQAATKPTLPAVELAGGGDPLSTMRMPPAPSPEGGDPLGTMRMPAVPPSEGADPPSTMGMPPSPEGGDPLST